MEGSFGDPPASPTAACTQELNSPEAHGGRALHIRIGHGAANNHDCAHQVEGRGTPMLPCFGSAPTKTATKVPQRRLR